MPSHHVPSADSWYGARFGEDDLPPIVRDLRAVLSVEAQTLP